jgi:hypothetical protein
VAILPRPAAGGFVTMTAAALIASPLVVEAQPGAKMPRVGFVEAGAARSANQLFVDAFRVGLREIGYIDGQNISVDEPWADGRIDRATTSRVCPWRSRKVSPTATACRERCGRRPRRVG